MVLSMWESLLKLSLVLGFQLCYLVLFQLCYLVLLLNHRGLSLRGGWFLSYVLVGCIYSEFEPFENTDLIISGGENCVRKKKRSQRRTNTNAPNQTKV